MIAPRTELMTRTETENREVSNAAERLCSGMNNVRVPAIIAKLLLLRHPTLIRHGRVLFTHARSIGAGVYEIYLKDMTGPNQ
jgi:GTPase